MRASSNITGAECAREILQAAQIHDVEVVETNDFLGDHYDPTKKKLCLSSNVYNTPSVASLGIAAHETGHAIQHAKAYAPLKARMAVVPLTMVASQMLPFVIFGGIFFHITGLITLGIYCYAILLVFQLITLPVEFDASRRAKIILQQMGIVQPGAEVAGVNNVLTPPRSPMSPRSSRRSAICSGSFPCGIAGIKRVASVEKMSHVLTAPRRISDLLSSAPASEC